MQYVAGSQVQAVAEIVTHGEQESLAAEGAIGVEGLRVEGLGFGFRVEGLRSRLWGLGWRIRGFGAIIS